MLKEAIDKIVKEDCRLEALELANLAPKNRVNELLQFYKDDNGNLFCMCLDVIKYDLYKEGKILKTDFPSFGEPYISFEL